MTDQLRKAQELHRQGDLAAALAIYQQLLEQKPDNVDVIHQMGILYAQQQDYTQALEYLDQALKFQPRSAPFHNSKGNILSLLGDQEAALSEYKQSVKADPRYAIAYNNIGRCLYLQEKFIAAQKSYVKALELNPNYGDAHYNQGVLLLKLGDLSAARAALEKALALSPKNPAIYGQMAQIYLQEAQYPLATEYLEKRLDLQPSHIESWHYLGVAYFALNKLKEAAHSFEQVLQLTHRHPECYEHLAIVYLKLDDKEKSLTYFLRQLEVKPTANAAFNTGVLLIEKGRHRDAIEYLKYAVSLDPLHLPAHLNLGVEYLKLQQPNEALHHYQLAAAIKPDDPEIQHILSALTQQRTPDKAPAEYLKNLFDQYAEYYDKHLTESLHYRVPQQLHAAIYQIAQDEQPEWTILDLGCGTGLCGELFKEFAAKLIGIDISQEMVSVAKTKNIYDELHVADIEKALDDYRNVDLIVAADVFTYIGELSPIFRKVKQTLKPNGFFTFSVEKTIKSPFELQPSIRYAHARDYIEALAAEYHFQILRLEEMRLRMQKDTPVIGYLAVLKNIVTRTL